MAVPTIGTVSPSSGATAGGNLVEITGTGFRVPAALPALQPTVRVSFGAAVSPQVQVVSSTRLLASVPRTPLALTEPAYGEGAVSVAVQNLDDDGAPIAGELVTQAGVYTFQRVQLAGQSDLTRLIRALLREFKAQTLPNVVSTTHTDYDPESGDLLNTTALAQLPGIALVGPELNQNRLYTSNQQKSYVVGSGPESVIRRAPYVVDVGFILIGQCRTHIEAINLMVVTVLWFERNKWLYLDRDPTESSKGQVRYPIDIPRGDDLKMDAAPNDSNIHSFSGHFIIRGFPIEDLTGFSGHQVVSRTAQITEDPGILAEQFPED